MNTASQLPVSVLRALATLSMGVGLLCCAQLAYAVHSVMPFNPVDLPKEKELNVRYWSPQGWKFFTRNPREDWVLTFRPGPDGRWVNASIGPNARFSNLLGLDRRPRSQMIETAWIVNAISSTAWSACKEDAAMCIATSPAAPTVVQNPSPHPTLCGTIGLAFQQQKPWAWAHAHALRMPSRVAKVEVTCLRR